MIVHRRIQRLQRGTDRGTEIGLAAWCGFRRCRFERGTEKRTIGRERAQQNALLAERDKCASVAFKGVDEIGNVGLCTFKTVGAHVGGKHGTAHVKRDDDIPALRRHHLRAMPPLWTRRGEQAERKT